MCSGCRLRSNNTSTGRAIHSFRSRRSSRPQALTDLRDNQISGECRVSNVIKPKQCASNLDSKLSSEGAMKQNPFP